MRKLRSLFFLSTLLIGAADNATASNIESLAALSAACQKERSAIFSLITRNTGVDSYKTWQDILKTLLKVREWGHAPSKS